MDNALVDTADVFHYINVQKRKTPNYRKLVDEGAYIAPLPYSLVISDSRATKYKLRVTQVGHGSYGNSDVTIDYTSPAIRGVYASNAVTVGAYLSNRSDLESKFVALANSRTNKLLTKIQAQSLPLIMMYRERHATGRLITKFLDDAIYACRNIRNPQKILHRYGFSGGRNLSGRFSRRFTKRYLARLKRAPGCKDIGDAWLQYRFAWTPLIHDIIDSYNAASNQEKKLHTYHRTAGLPFQFNSTSGGADGEMTGFYRVGCSYTFTDQSLAAAGSLMNVAATAWDSVPYSFVVDWIANISQYLDLQTATLGAEFSSGYESILKDTSIKIRLPSNHTDLFGKLPTNYAWITYSYSGQMAARHDLEFYRNVLTTFPEPRLEYPLAASLTHGIDSLCLVLQKLMKRKLK